MKRVAPPTLPQGPQHYWSQMVLMSRGDGFTITDIYKASSCRTRRTIKDYVLFCAKQGFIDVVGERPAPQKTIATVYKVRDPRMAAPIMRRADFADDRGRRAQQMWTAMRGLRQFTAQELALAASTDTVQVKEKAAREYLLGLCRAGYVAALAKTGRNGARLHWKLMPARNTGPLSPSLMKRGTVVYDRNLNRFVNVTGSATAGAAA